MTPSHELEALVRAVEDLQRRSTGRLVSITIGVPPGFSPMTVAGQLRARLARGPMADVAIDGRERAGSMRVLAAEFARILP